MTRCNHPLVPQGRENLAYKAASIVLNAKGINRQPVRSAFANKFLSVPGWAVAARDAAAMLVGLNRFFASVYVGAAGKWASALGADVPFFIQGSSGARAWDRRTL